MTLKEAIEKVGVGGRGKKIKNSFATYIDLTTLNNECDLIEVSNILLNWGNIPKTLGDVRAFEIALLARAYLELRHRMDGLEK